VKRIALSLLLSVLVGATSGVVAQTTIEEARKQGADLGKAMRADESLGPNDAKLAQLPGYAGTDLPEKVYFDDPDRLASDGGMKAGTDDAFGTVTDKARTRPSFSNAEILAATSRGSAIEKDPEAYLGGQSIGGTEGSCTPLPPSVGGKGAYEATCNQGSKVTEAAESCRGNMVPTVVNTARWFYYGVLDKSEGYGFAKNSVMQAKVSAGICRAEPVSKHICDAQIEMGAGGTNVEDYRKYCKKNVSGNAQLYSCSSEVPASELPNHFNSLAGTVYLKKEGTVSVTVARNEGTCPALSADASCGGMH
jgi:conjugal transfer mating pair stabilization protein TraN